MNYNLSMKTVLITGGAGFLGSHICDKFIEENWYVIVVDNLLTGSTDNIAHLIGNENFKFIKYNVTNYLSFQPAMLLWAYAAHKALNQSRRLLRFLQAEHISTNPQNPHMSL